MSADWLLSEDDSLPAAAAGAERAESGTAPAGGADAARYPAWMDHLPAFLLNALKRYGWLYGVYMAVGGFIFAAFGFVIRLILRGQILGSGAYDGLFPGSDPFSGMQQKSWSGFSAVTGVAIGIGLLIMLGGIALAAALRRWGRKGGEA